MMSKVPVVLCGKFESHITGLSKLLLPEYDVIHNCRSVEAATAEIPALLKGEPVQPSSGFGSNHNSSSPVSGRKVKAVIIGGGFAPKDFEAIKDSANKVKPLPFFRADTSRVSPSQMGPPSPEKLKERVVESMEKAKKDGGGEWKPGIHLF